MPRETHMNKVIWTAVVLMALVATTAQAQTTTGQQADLASFTVGVSVGVKASTTFDPAAQGSGFKPSTTLFEGFAAFKPVGHFGGEVRGMKLSASGNAAGSSNGGLAIFGSEINRNIVSSTPFVTGSQDYTFSQKVDLTKVDLLGNYTWGFTGGAATIFGGVTFVKGSGNFAGQIRQKFLLPAKLPNGSIDPVADGETYTATGSASADLSRMGVVVGTDFEKCIFGDTGGRLIVQGRLSASFFIKGSDDLTAPAFTDSKEIYLLRYADGINGTPTQRLTTLNLAPNQKAITASMSGKGSEIDGRVEIAYRRPPFEVGGGVVFVNFNGVGAPMFAAPAGQNPGQGSYRIANGLQTISPVVHVSFWF